MNHFNEGILIICDQQGQIKEVKCVNFKCINNNLIGSNFVNLFSNEFINKALSFLLDVKQKSASFGWELSLKKEISSLTNFYFNGITINSDIYILAAFNKVDFISVLETINQINNKQLNTIRDFYKLQQNQKDIKEINTYLFDELSRINNELVDTQRELAKTNAELTESNQLKNKLVGIVAHDLRNPISCILSYAVFLLETNLETEQIEFVDEIKNLSNHMLNLVQDLLSLSTIESGNIELKPEKFDLIKFFNTILKRQKLIAQKKQINITFLSQRKIITVYKDKNKLEQVITNLLSNAIKYSNFGTTVTVELFINNLDILICIKDQGQGIAESDINNLFKPFFKGSSKSTAGEPSTGLGLYICKKIIEAMGGKIWVESELNKGSIFYISLSLK